MDRLLRRELDRIAHDRTSGAAELAGIACRALLKWLRGNRHPSEAELLEVARALLRAQPSMAPLLRLANEVTLAIDSGSPARRLATRTRRFHRILRLAPDRIAGYFFRWMRSRGPAEIVYTYSYSSTVAKALIRARSRIECVCCSESRPGNEGILTALRLSRAGIKTEFFTDAALLSQTYRGLLVVLGADAILPGWVGCKVGSRVLIGRAHRAGGRVVLMVDTTKFWPEPTRSSPHWDWTFGPPDEIWKNPPRRLAVRNPYFELTKLSSRLRFLTERGWMTPGQVKRELKKIRISPRLAGLTQLED
jgi:ribose 1,5-bisphosphate isomerase